MAVINPFDFFLEPDAEQWPFAYDPVARRGARAVPQARAAGAAAGGLAGQGRSHASSAPSISSSASMRACRRRSATSSAWSRACRRREETLALAKGSCRDSGWLLVTILRHLGFAARFASGYLIQLMPDEKPLDGPEGPTHDFTDLHAWCEVYLPGAGWIGLDPTSGLLTGEGHIPLACTPEPSSAAPIEGAVEKSEVDVRLRHDGDARARDAAHHQALQRRAMGRRCSRVGEAIERDIGKRRRAAHHGRRADLRVDRRHGRRGMEHRWRSGRRSGAWPACCSASSPTASPRGRCCISARANGIPASSCRAGRSAATGARTASRSGATRISIAAGGQADRRHAGDGAALRAGLRRAPAARSRLPASAPSRTPGTTCGASGACRATSTVDAAKAEGPDGARAPGADLRAGTRERRRHRAAARSASTTAAAAGAAGRGSCARRSAT